jgi:hypothetical protein
MLLQRGVGGPTREPVCSISVMSAMIPPPPSMSARMYDRGRTRDDDPDRQNTSDSTPSAADGRLGDGAVIGSNRRRAHRVECRPRRVLAIGPVE